MGWNPRTSHRSHPFCRGFQIGGSGVGRSLAGVDRNHYPTCGDFYPSIEIGRIVGSLGRAGAEVMDTVVAAVGV